MIQPSRSSERFTFHPLLPDLRKKVPLLSNQFNPFQRFRETLKHEDHIHNQIEACRMAFNRGDANEVMYAVESLMLLITPNMIDERFLEELQTLEDEWQAAKATREEEFRKRLKQARNGCPDLIVQPSGKPDMEHFKSWPFILEALQVSSTFVAKPRG